MSINLFSLLQNAAGEGSLRSALGAWRQKIAQTVDDLVSGALGFDYVRLNEQTVGPTAVPDAGFIYTKEVNGITELFYRDDSTSGGVEIQITSNGQTVLLMTQSAWFVDSVNGNDKNSGSTLPTAIKTLGELTRRWQGKTVAQNTTINLAGTFAEILSLDSTLPIGITVSIVGETPTQTSTGSLTAAFVAYQPATNVDAKVTDAAQTWATKLGQRIRMTSGGASNGSIAWVMKDLGANVARVSQFVVRSTGAAAIPVNGDTYVTETLKTVVGGYDLRLHGGGFFTVKDIDANGAGQTGGLMQTVQGSSNLSSGGIAKLPVFDGCRFSGSISHTWRYSSAFLVGCVNDTVSFRPYFSEIQLFGHLNYLGFFSVQAGDRVSIQTVSVGQGGNGYAAFNNSIISLSTDALGIFDVTAGGAALDIEAATVRCSVAQGVIFGTGNTIAQNVRIRSGDFLTYVTKPVITGTGNDSLIGGTAKAWAAVPYIEPANNAMIVARA